MRTALADSILGPIPATAAVLRAGGGDYRMLTQKRMTWLTSSIMATLTAQRLTGSKRTQTTTQPGRKQ
eukprot:2131472-Pleurochrysis_carterae.AAC.1